VHPEVTVSRLRAARSYAKAHAPDLYDPIYDGLITAGIPE
jgi:hypothetical protein